MIKYLYIAAGGATGTLLRYYISGLAHKIGTGIFPWGTVAVNLIGALLIGLSWGLFDRITIPANNRLFLFIGLFGGFTTFSTFA
ncbi:MAG: CrcB family protein, partial [Bacteroidota bacterium]|nr:CrcB family protein [Bacteroidota bacterium]